MHAAEELRYLVLAAQREGNRVLSRGLRPLGLTPSQAEVLRVLSEHQPLTLRELGGLLVCDSGQSPSRLVDRLVDKGFVERGRSQTDRRSVVLSLTNSGADVCSQVVEAEEGLYGAIADALGGDDPSPAVDVLRKIVAGTPAGDALERRAAAGAEE